MAEATSPVETQTVTGSSTDISFEKAFKDAVLHLNFPRKEETGHTDLATLTIEILSMTVDVGGISPVPTRLTVTIKGTKKTHC